MEPQNELQFTLAYKSMLFINVVAYQVNTIKSVHRLHFELQEVFI